MPAATVELAPTTPARPDYRSLQPARLADNRAGYATIDGRSQGTGKVTAGAPLLVTIAGRAGVPAAGQVAAVALNVTAVDSASGGSFLTVYPANETRPLASNLNVGLGEAVANSVIAKLSPSGRIRIYAASTMHIIVDVAGYWTIGGIVPLSPARLADSRPGEPTVDGLAGTGKIAGGSAMQLKVTGRGGVASTATSVALNVVVTGSRAAGFLTAFATGKPLPLASNLNHVAGATTARCASPPRSISVAAPSSIPLTPSPLALVSVTRSARWHCTSWVTSSVSVTWATPPKS